MANNEGVYVFPDAMAKSVGIDPGLLALLNQNVEISYLADALTGEMLVKDSLGNLLTKLAAHNRPGINLGCYYISYDDGESPKSMVVTYMVNSKGDVVKNEDGNVSYDVSYTFEDKYGRSTTQVVNVVLDLTAPKVEIRSPENGIIAFAHNEILIYQNAAVFKIIKDIDS